MKQSTVDALDEADRLNAQMSCLLFTNEQDRRLFGYSPILWEPGVPLGRYWINDENKWCPINNDTRRPMFEVFNDVMAVAEYLNYYNRCRTCQTWWAFDEPCWVCGEMREPMSEQWRKLMFFCHIMGLERTEEQIDEMLIVATARAEDARQKRREALRKMQKEMARSLEVVGQRLTEFGSSASRAMMNLETFQFPYWHPIHEPEDDGGYPPFRRWQLVLPRRRGPSVIRTFYDEAGDLSWVRPPVPAVAIFMKKPFVMPDISRRYDPLAEISLPHPDYRSFNVVVMLNRACRAVKLYAPIIKEPKIVRDNPVLEGYLRREELRDTNPLAYEVAQQRRQHEVRGNRGRSGAVSQRMRNTRQG